MRHCEHLKTNGDFCGSPALRGRDYCFFHLTDLGRRLCAGKNAALPAAAPPLELPLLEDAASIQLALMQVTDALLRGALDPRRAGLVLYALQTASSNLRHVARDAQQRVEAVVCNQYDSFEQDYGLEEYEADLHATPATSEAPSPSPLPSPETAPSPDVNPDAVRPLGNSEADTPLLNSAAVSPFLHSNVTGPVASDAPAPFLRRVPREPLAEDATPAPTCAPDGEPFASRPGLLDIPAILSDQQYQQLKTAIFGHQMLFGIDPTAPGMKRPVASQRPAQSQRVALKTRKPAASASPAAPPEEAAI